MFGTDTRGQAIQIGAIILFSFVVLTFSLYQATVVPDNNTEVEFNHNDEVQQDLTQLRASMLTAAATGDGYPVPVDLGPRYPPRVIAVNPGPPSGTLTTVSYGSGQLTVANVRATDSEIDDYWAGSVSYTTNGMEYRPNYNFYAEAPTTAYENSVLYNVFDSPAAGGPATVGGSTVRLSSDQTLVDGKRVNLVALVGERQDSATETVSVDPTATTIPSRTVTVQGDSGPVIVSLPTNLNVEAWRTLLEDEYVANGGYVEASTVGVSSGVVSFELRETEGGTPVTYQLRVPAVGVGASLPSGVAPVPTYTTAESPTTVTAAPGETLTLTAGVFNQYNGPESGVSVSSDGGTTTTTTDADGEAAVTYTAPTTAGSYSVTIEADFDGDGTFGEDSTETVTFTVDVTGGGGGGSGDGTPPTVSGISATPDPLTKGDDLDLAATFDDTAGRGGSDIISASWSDARSGDSGSLDAVDSQFDQSREAVETTVPGSTTAGWATGDHDITITGTDANGNTVSRTVTVTVQSAGGGPSLITAVEPNPQALSDSAGEFVRLQIPSGVDTTGWTLREQDDSTPISRNLDGEVYLVRDEAAFESQWPVDPAKVFQYDSQIILDNAGQTVELVDDGGTVVDRFSYGDGDGGSFGAGGQFSLSGEGQVAYRTQSGGSFTDTDSASDWAEDAECDFFGGGMGCGASDTTAPQVTSGPSVSPSTVTAGDTFDVTVTIDDSSTGGSIITGASYVDRSNSANSGSLSASDGAFDEPTEAVEATVDTTGWATGDHTIEVSGTDDDGNTVTRTVTVTVESPSQPTTSNVRLTNTEASPTSSDPAGGRPYGVEVAFDSDEQLQSFTVDLSGPNSQSASYDETEFTESVTGGTYTYTLSAPYDATDDGSYTADVRDATDADGNTETDTSTGSETFDYYGVSVEYYEAASGEQFDSLSDVPWGSPTSTGTQARPFNSPDDDGEEFAYRYTAHIYVPADGTYEFRTTSDDGSRLYIDGTRVVNNDGLHSPRSQEGSISLTQGWHDLTVTFFEHTGGDELDVSWDGTGRLSPVETEYLVPRPAAGDEPPNDGSGNQNGIQYDGELTTTSSDSAVQFDIENVGGSVARVQSVRVDSRISAVEEMWKGSATSGTGREIEISGGDSTGYRDAVDNSKSALPADGSSIDLDSNAVLSTSGSGATATVSIGDLGDANTGDGPPSWNEYDLPGLTRVSQSDPWDIRVVLELQGGGDVVYYFQEP